MCDVGENMIEIKNLTKIYFGSKEQVKALDNVSLVLPDKGLVFVLGKSGSGKSTFLNMLGGLDSVTEGDILVNGVSIVNLKNSKLDMYRNDYVGIIYQNFNLFPNDSVKQNIMESGHISNKKITYEQIVSLCEELDLVGKENELVKNLSGGQKQRVAIARSLIKDPKIILADEPTGNLDNKTTKVIFDTLKKISKDKLVVVISHDIESAEKYADRIIYLSDGKVVDDVVRNFKYKSSSEDSMKLPSNREFSDEEVEEINDSLKKHNLRVEKRVEKFIESKEIEREYNDGFKLSESKRIFKLSLSISNKFFRSTIVSFVTTVLMLTFIIGVLSISHTLSQFDSEGAVKNIAGAYQNKAFVLNKAYSYYDDVNDINKNYHIKVQNEDIEKFKDGGYEGNIFKVYNTPAITGSVNINNEMGLVSGKRELYLGVYTYTSLGTVICDYDYLRYLFGELKVIAGSLENTEKTSKLIVTDYFADSILAMDIFTDTNQYISEDLENPYSKIIDKILWNRYQIGAVIETGYKERYAELIEKFEKIEREPQNQSEIIKEIMGLPMSAKFYEELSSSLNFTYSVNTNFYEDYIEETYNLAIWLRNSVIEYGGESSYDKLLHLYYNSNLENNSVMMTVALYNELFNKDLTDYDISGFEPQEIRIKNYTVDQDSSENPKNDLTLKVVGVTNCGPGCLGMIDRASYELLAQEAMFTYALMFDDIEKAMLVDEIGKENFFYTPIESFSKIFEICDIIDIFSNIFMFIAAILIVIQLIMIVSHNLRTIKKNQYRIGVYRGLGCSSGVFSLSCLFNTIILVFSTFVSSLLFVKFASVYVNDILIENFTKFMNSDVVSSFTFVSFNFNNLLLYMFIILVVGGLSLLAPIIRLRKMKPNLILNKAE